MNLLLHGVRPEKMTIKNGDTLSYDWPEDPDNPNEGVQFDAVVMNPPYSAKNWNKAGLKVSDPRLEIVGTLPPDSKGDFAFLLHGLYHLGINSTMAIVLPHGVLFRGSSEGEIRKKLLEKSKIDTIIGLPSNLLEEAKDDSFATKRIVFIIDEAHRTTMGQMMGDIKKYFKKNGLFFGFTGTPLFDENNIKGKINEKSEVINTTEKLFGSKLHQYKFKRNMKLYDIHLFNGMSIFKLKKSLFFNIFYFIRKTVTYWILSTE